MLTTTNRPRSASPTRNPRVSNSLQRHCSAEDTPSLYFTKTPSSIFNLEPVKKQEEISLKLNYSPKITELNDKAHNLSTITYEFQQLKTKEPLYNNYHMLNPKCEAIGCFFIEHMLNNVYKGVERAATEYHYALLLEPTVFQEIKTSILGCCGARNYKYSREETARMSFVHDTVPASIGSYVGKQELLLKHCKEAGKLRCYDSNFSEQIQKIRTIMLVNDLDKMFIRIGLLNLRLKDEGHVVVISIFRCNPEEGDGYWIIPNDPNETPYIPLKVSLEDIKNSRIKFNNLLSSMIVPHNQNVPLTIPMTCYIGKDDQMPNHWYTSLLTLGLENPGENNKDIFNHIVNTFLASLGGKDTALARHAVNIYNHLSPEQSEMLDINNESLNGERIITVDGKPEVKENLGIAFVNLAVEWKLHDVAKVFIEELGVEVNLKGITSFSQVKSLTTSLTTPLITAIQVKDPVMVDLLINKYQADPLFPPDDPAYTSAKTNREIQDILMKKCPNLKLDSEGYLKLNT